MSGMVKNIRVGGVGGEARVMVQARNIFPGLGGEITSEQVVACALREEFFAYPGEGQRLFLKHTLIKKLDDYFLKKGFYGFPHVARPLGSVAADSQNKEGYLYEWVFGQESFPWQFTNGEGGYDFLVLDEWNIFSSKLKTAGVNVDIDTTDPDNGRVSKNIIHQLCQTDGAQELNLFWKRIDFGDSSIHIDFDQLECFLVSNARDLAVVLGLDRYRLLVLADAYLRHRGQLSEPHQKDLEERACRYRLSSLRHKIAELVIR